MTPSNNSNGNDPVYTIEDTNNVKHQVVPVAHTHSQSEVEGLSTALSGKMDSKTIDQTPSNNSDHLISSKGVKDAIAGISSSFGRLFATMSDYEAPYYLEISQFLQDEPSVGEILIEVDAHFGNTIEDVITATQGTIKWDDTNTAYLYEDGHVLLHYFKDESDNYYLTARTYTT